MTSSGGGASVVNKPGYKNVSTSEQQVENKQFFVICGESFAGYFLQLFEFVKIFDFCYLILATILPISEWRKMNCYYLVTVVICLWVFLTEDCLAVRLTNFEGKTSRVYITFILAWLECHCIYFVKCIPISWYSIVEISLSLVIGKIYRPNQLLSMKTAFENWFDCSNYDYVISVSIIKTFLYVFDQLAKSRKQMMNSACTCLTVKNLKIGGKVIYTSRELSCMLHSLFHVSSYCVISHVEIYRQVTTWFQAPS